ncbi:hypothetical protein D3C72_1430930 [compost metagenome]
MPHPLVLSHNNCVLDVHLGDFPTHCRQCRQRLFIGVNHVGEIKQQGKLREICRPDQADQFMALEIFMLFQSKTQAAVLITLFDVLNIRTDARQHL